MKYLGIDYGTKKTGIAVSDTLGTIAFPRDVLPTNSVLSKHIADLIKKEDIGGIVIGESKNLQGELNSVDVHVKKFTEDLRRFLCHKDDCKDDCNIKIYFEDERFSTKQARNLPNKHVARGPLANKRKMIGVFRGRTSKFADAQAAAIILQSFLDKRQNMR